MMAVVEAKGSRQVVAAVASALLRSVDNKMEVQELTDFQNDGNLQVCTTKFPKKPESKIGDEIRMPNYAVVNNKEVQEEISSQELQEQCGEFQSKRANKVQEDQVGEVKLPGVIAGKAEILGLLKQVTENMHEHTNEAIRTSAATRAIIASWTRNDEP